MVGKAELSIAQKGKLPSQRLFIEAWDGDVDATAKRLELSVVECRRWVNSSWFLDALTKREEREMVLLRRDNIYQLEKAIMPRLEIQSFWSDVAADTQVKMADRLKASEMLAKSHGMLIEKTELKVTEVKPVAHKLDIEDRLKIYLNKPKDAEFVPSPPLQEIEDDWLATPECAGPDPSAGVGPVRECAPGRQPGDDAAPVPA